MAGLLAGDALVVVALVMVGSSWRSSWLHVGATRRCRRSTSSSTSTTSTKAGKGSDGGPRRPGRRRGHARGGVPGRDAPGSRCRANRSALPPVAVPGGGQNTRLHPLAVYYFGTAWAGKAVVKATPIDNPVQGTRLLGPMWVVPALLPMVPRCAGSVPDRRPSRRGSWRSRSRRSCATSTVQPRRHRAARRCARAAPRAARRTGPARRGSSTERGGVDGAQAVQPGGPHRRGLDADGSEHPGPAYRLRRRTRRIVCVPARRFIARSRPCCPCCSVPESYVRGDAGGAGPARARNRTTSRCCTATRWRRSRGPVRRVVLSTGQFSAAGPSNHLAPFLRLPFIVVSSAVIAFALAGGHRRRCAAIGPHRGDGPVGADRDAAGGPALIAVNFILQGIFVYIPCGTTCR